MNISWGYSPKSEKFIPLSDFPGDKYLIIVKQAIENLGWRLSHVSASGIIAYTPLSFQSYSEEISVNLKNGFAVVKSECVGIQMLFNDYGKNEANLERLFHEFEYVQYHLQDHWDQQVASFNEFAAKQDDNYFEKAPLAVKNKISNLLHLFWPQKGYVVTPILLNLNILVFLSFFVVAFVLFFAFMQQHPNVNKQEVLTSLIDIKNSGFLNRGLLLNGEYWRLITYQFLHGSIGHLFFNMYALVYLGLIIENKLGWKAFLLIYILTGVCAGLTSIAYHEDLNTIGSSGAIMGLFGAMLAMVTHNFFEKNANRALLVSTLLICVIMLINGSFARRTDNMAHVGGLVSGFIFTSMLLFKINNRQKKIAFAMRYITVFLTFVMFTWAVFSLTPRYQHKEFMLLKNNFERNIQGFYGVLSMKRSLTPEAMIAFVKENGLKPAQANLNVTNEMAKLTLNDRFNLERSLKTELAKETHAIALLMLKDLKSGNHAYAKLISQKLTDLMKMQVEFRDSLAKQ